VKLKQVLKKFYVKQKYGKCFINKLSFILLTAASAGESAH